MAPLPSFVLYLASFLVTVLHRPHLLVAVAQTNLTTGSALKPPNYITSSSGEFAFGFRALDSSPPQFILAVWFNFKSSNSTLQTVVWFAMDALSGYTVTATEQSILSLDAAGQLSLTDNSSGSNVVWSPNTNQNYGSLLKLLDSGNLQLIANDDDSTVVWQSFQHPTDTLLPGQTMHLGTNLISKNTDTDFSPGRFSLNVQLDGNIVLYMMDLPGDNAGGRNAYWSTSTNHMNPTIFFDDPGNLYYKLENDTELYNLTTLRPNSTVRYYQRATLDPDGTVRVYVLPKNTVHSGNASWVVTDLFPSDGCSRRSNSLQGMCGPNAYCISNDGYLDCECPSGYIWMDAQYRYKGCRPDFVPNTCDGKDHSAEFKLVELNKTSWTIGSTFYKKHASTTEKQCRDFCLNDCFCAAALFDGSNCMEMGQLTGGQQTNDTTLKALIKVRTSDPLVPEPSRSKLPYIFIACLAFLPLPAIVLLIHCYISNRAIRSRLSVRIFTYKELHRATNGFNKLLGQGGFGRVYHGVLKSLQPSDVAVKELNRSDEYRETEFTNEVQSIGRIHHRNLVRMIGYCKEGKHRMLVFEFMPRGSLRGFLFQPERPPWSWRAEAALGIARGLEYLHDGCISPIIHCDIKPDNILLDDNHVPKITDFGIAKLLGNHQVQTTVTNVRGTRGYIAPEWFRGDARIDTKADVYSFGVVLLEMICCRMCQMPVRNDDDDEAEETVTLFGWAGQLVNSGKVELLLQRDDDDAMEDLQRVDRFTRVALWCIEPNPSLRPTMHQVVQMLEGGFGADALPTTPSCFVDPSALISFVNISNAVVEVASDDQGDGH